MRGSTGKDATSQPKACLMQTQTQTQAEMQMQMQMQEEL